MSRAAAASKWSVEHKTLAWFTGAAVILLLVLACAFVTARGLVDSAKDGIRC